MGMAHLGANFIKGSFTVPSDAGSAYTLNFGKAFSKYLFFIEIDDESKTELYNTSLVGRRAYTFLGKYPAPKINSIDNPTVCFCHTYIPSTGALSTSSANVTLANNSITFPCIGTSSNNQGAVIKELTYNYFVCEME